MSDTMDIALICDKHRTSFDKCGCDAVKKKESSMQPSTLEEIIKLINETNSHLDRIERIIKNK